jgi:RNA polymerase sigma factor (TIGR02999 family)
VEERLFSLVLPDLHKLARHMMSGERREHSLQPTALMNEAYVRLVGARARDWQDRRHFFAVAARAMRHLLIDHARARPAGAKIPMDGFEELLRGRDAQLEMSVDINGLLQEMEKKHPDWCPIVDLKFFAGFSDEETATALDLPLRTMQRQFSDARRWLYERLRSKECKVRQSATNS